MVRAFDAVREAVDDGQTPANDKAEAFRMTLTQLAVDRLTFAGLAAKMKAKDGRDRSNARELIAWDQLQPGFGVRITRKGVKSWIVMTRVAPQVQGGKAITVQKTLDRVIRMTLADARGEARKIMQEAQRRIDPRPGKHDNPDSSGFTFDKMIDDYLAKHVRPKYRPSTAKEAERLLKLPLERWRTRQAVDIKRGDVRALFNEISERRLRSYSGSSGGATTEAGNVLKYVRVAYRWAMDQGWPNNKDLIESDPTAGIKKHKAVSRDRALDDVEIGCFWRATETLPWPFKEIFQLLALTGQRAGEVSGLRWPEVEPLDRTTWQLPGARTRNKVANDVHLSPQAMKIIRPLPRWINQPLVFPTRTGTLRKMSLFDAQQVLNVAMTAELAKLGRELEHWTPHDLRRSVASGMARIGIDTTVADKVLGHVIPGVPGIYQRHHFWNERKAALDLWAAHVERLAHGVAKDDAA
jgi:integrase